MKQWQIDAGGLRLEPKMLAALVYSNVLMLLIPTALTLGNYALLGVPPSWPYLVCLSAGTFLLYQADRAVLISPEDLANKSARVAWILGHRSYVWSSMITAALVAAMAASRLQTRTLIVMAPMLALGLAYALPILPGRRRLKLLPYTKAITVGAVWAFSSVVIPALDAGRSWDRAVGLLFVYRIGWLLPNLLLSNWYDRDGDRSAGIRTFASHLSPRGVLVACRLLLIATFAGAVFAAANGAPRLLLVDGAGLVIFWGLLVRGLPGSPWFYLLVIDLIVAWPLATTCASWLSR